MRGPWLLGSDFGVDFRPRFLVVDPFFGGGSSFSGESSGGASAEEASDISLASLSE